MAIEILSESPSLPWLSVKHTYCHDLESIFYVLLWMCICYGWANNKTSHRNVISKWHKKETEDIGFWKSIQMKEEKFENEFLPKFSPKFKGIKELVVRFWGILFYSDKELWTGAYKDHQTLYDPIIKAFDDAIEILKL
ncbi:Bgt-50896 [Blumeria graminis f. sp. tritici]|uniref:Bgt-50896 n=2 Tax=Blumeria graminis TaxID=34373 RepID=A0A9X9MKK0_BLUGR|nr:Bgt-50896 [Blumeria graminis f. sp. tritici]